MNGNEVDVGRKKKKLRSGLIELHHRGTMEAQQEEYVPPIQPADSYNGSAHENFTWSQSISDLDVVVKVPESLRNLGDLRVDVSATGIKVEARRDSRQSVDPADDVGPQKANCPKAQRDPLEWTIVLEGDFTFPTKKNETLWSFVPGECVNIHLEKAKERWWQALIIGQPRIELDKIDCSRDLFDLGETERMKVGELMWSHRQKLLGENKSGEYGPEVKTRSSDSGRR